MPSVQDGRMRRIIGKDTCLRSLPNSVADDEIVSSVHTGTSTFIGITSARSGIAAKPPKPVLPRKA